MRYSDDGKKFRSRKDVEKHIENNDRTDLNGYIFDFSTYGGGGSKPFIETPKGKTTPGKVTPKGKSPKIVSRKSFSGVKSPKSPKKPFFKKNSAKNALNTSLSNKKKSAIKTLAQKLVVKMTFVTRKRSADDDSDRMSNCSSDSEVDSDEAKGENSAKDSKSPKKVAVSKKRKLAGGSKPAEKEGKSKSPQKVPLKSPRKSIENGSGGSPTKKVANGTDHGVIGSSPSKRTSGRLQKSESSDNELSPMKRVRGRSLSNVDSPAKKETDEEMPSPRRGTHVKSPRSKSASSAGEDASDSQSESPSKGRRSRRDSARDSSMDISHTQVDGAVSESPIKRGRGRPRKNSNPPEPKPKPTPAKAGRGRPRKDSVKATLPVAEAKGKDEEKETPKKQPGRRGAAKKDEEKEEEAEVESSVEEAATQSPAPRGRGRPRKTPVRFLQSEPEDVKPIKETPPPAKGRRGRPRNTPVQSNAEESKVEAVEPKPESAADKADKGNSVDEVSETPVKRGRGRPRKANDLTPQPEKSKDKEESETPSKGAPKSSGKEKEQPAETPKDEADLTEDDKTTEETPAKKGRGRPRKTPEVPKPTPTSVKRGRGRPKKAVAELEETVAENKAETSEDDALPTLQFEGDEPPVMKDTKETEEPPVLSLADGDTSQTKDKKAEPKKAEPKKAELKKAESDGELPPLVAVPVSPRQSSRKPKPKFDKDFISPTKKLIAYYEADRGKAATKKTKDVKGKEPTSPPAKKSKVMEKAKATATALAKKKAAEKQKDVAPPPAKKTKAIEKVKVVPTYPLQKVHPKIVPRKGKVTHKEPILETLAAEEEGKISPPQQIFTDNTFELMSGLENTNCGLEMVPDLCNSLMEDVVGDGSVLPTMVDPTEADQAPAISIADRLSAVLMDHDYTKEFRRSLSCESLAMVASSPKRKRSMSWTDPSAQGADDTNVSAGSEAQKQSVSQPQESEGSTKVVEKASEAADLVARSVKKAKAKVGGETEHGTIKRKASKEAVLMVKPSKRQKAAVSAAAAPPVLPTKVSARGKSRMAEKVEKKVAAAPKGVKPSILRAKPSSDMGSLRKAHKAKPEMPQKEKAEVSQKAILKVPPPKVTPVKPTPLNASPPKRKEPERPSPIKPKKVSLSLNLEVTKSLPENIFDVDMDEPIPSTSTDSAPEVVKVKTPEVTAATSEQPQTDTLSAATTAPNLATTAPSPSATVPSATVTSLSAAVTTPSPAVTTPSPAVTTPSPAVTTPSPTVTTPSPAVTIPAPAVTTPSPTVTVPSPATPTPSPSTTTPSRRVSIGPVETHEIDQTKSPGPPSTTFDLAALAFVPPPSKQKQRKKSVEANTKKTPIKKVGQWSFTPLKSTSPKPPQSPDTPTAGGPKSILKKNLKPDEES